MKIFIALLALAAMAAATDMDMQPIDAAVMSRLSGIRPMQGHAGEIQPHNAAISERLREALENLRGQMEHGSPENGIPPLDPFNHDRFEVRVEEGITFRADIVLTDIDVRGLKEFVIENIEFRLIGLSILFDFRVPKTVYNSRYSVSGRAFLIIPFNPSGVAHLSADDIRVTGVMTLGTLISGHLELRGLDTQFDIGDTEVFIEGILGDGLINSLLNRILNAVSDNFIQDQRDRVSAFLTDSLFDLLAPIIGEFSLSDILG